MLPPEAIEEFNQIYEKHFAEKLAPKDAEELALKVYNFFKTILRPVEESTNLARDNPGQVSDTERSVHKYGNKTESQKS